MHSYLQKRVRITESVTPTGANGPVVFTTTGDKWIITPANPISIVRWGLVLNAAKDASVLALSLATRPVAGSDTNRVVSDTLTDTATVRAAGVVLERNPILGPNPNQSTGSDGSLVNVAEGGLVKIFPGQEAVFAVTTGAASTGSGYIFAEYIEDPDVATFTSLQSSALTYTVVKLAS